MNLPARPSLGPLGRSISAEALAAARCDASLLFPIARAPQRAALGGDGSGSLPFAAGADVWTAYELSWLNMRGKPQVAIAHIAVDCRSTNIIESKSLKLYLNSYSECRFASAKEVHARMVRDIAAAASPGEPHLVHALLAPPDEFAHQTVRELAGINLDALDIECPPLPAPAPELLYADFAAPPVEETLASHLLKSHCPVTGQPDWASVQIMYRGAPIAHEGLLRYIISWRQHSGFHEHCVEQIFCDIHARCRPQHLRVYARYCRRGGIDINPWRSSDANAAPPTAARTARQ